MAEPQHTPLILTYRYRLLPTRQQHAALARILEDQRQLYNACLAERIDAYRDPDAVRGMRMTLTHRAGIMTDTAEYDRCARRQDEIEQRCHEAVEAATRPILMREGWETIKDCPRKSPIRAEMRKIASDARHCILTRELAGRKPKSFTYFDQTNSLTKCRQALPEMAAVPAYLQHWTLKRLDDAYKAFFSRVKKGTGKAGFPRFRGRDYWSSFGFSQNRGFRFDGRRLRFKGMPGGLRLKLHRPLPGDIGAAGHRSEQLRAIVLTREGRRWMISLQSQVEPQNRCQSRTAAVGIDVGLFSLIAQSDGVLVPAPQPGRRASRAMRRAQRTLSRAKRGSKRRAKTRERLARLHRTITNIRSTKLHTQAARLTRCYATIAAEDLTIRNMSRSAAGTVDNPGRNVAAKAGLNRSILDAGWGRLRQLIAYKATRDGSRLIEVDPRYTSQTCPACGATKPKTLAERVHRCSECGLVLDRDVAAAKVILSIALKGAATSSPASAGDAGLPVGGVSGAIGRRVDLGNTAGAILPDGGGNTASIHVRVREPQASTPKRRGPRPNDARQLALPFPDSRATRVVAPQGPRKNSKLSPRIIELQRKGRGSYGSVG